MLSMDKQQRERVSPHYLRYAPAHARDTPRVHTHACTHIGRPISIHTIELIPSESKRDTIKISNIHACMHAYMYSIMISRAVPIT